MNSSLVILDSLSICWELVPFSFERFDWVFDPYDGWLPFCWISY